MKKCSQCGKICESNFCPDCGSEMLEVNIEPEPNGDDAFEDIAKNVESVESPAKYEQSEKKSPKVNSLNALKSQTSALRNQSKKDVKTRAIISAIAAVIILAVVIFISINGNSIRGVWISSSAGELSTDRLKFDKSTVYIYSENIAANYTLEDEEVIIEHDGEFEIGVIQNIGKYKVLLFDDEVYYPEQHYNDIVAIQEEEYKKRAEEFKSQLETKIVGDWRKSFNLDTDNVYRFKEDGTYEEVFVNTGEDKGYGFDEGKYRVELGDDHKSVTLIIDDYDITWDEDKLEGALELLEEGRWFWWSESVESLDNEEAVTEWIKEGIEWNEKKEDDEAEYDNDDDTESSSGSISYSPNKYR